VADSDVEAVVDTAVDLAEVGNDEVGFVACAGVEAGVECGAEFCVEMGFEGDFEGDFEGSFEAVFETGVDVGVDVDDPSTILEGVSGVFFMLTARWT
jgi:hypothetical protein